MRYKYKPIRNLNQLFLGIGLISLVLVSCQNPQEKESKAQMPEEVFMDLQEIGEAYAPPGKACPKPHFTTVRMPGYTKPKLDASSPEARSLFPKPILLWHAPYLLYLDARVDSLSSVLTKEVGIPDQIEFTELAENPFSESEKERLKALYPKSRVIFFSLSEKNKISVIDHYNLYKGGLTYLTGRYIRRKNTIRGYLYAEINQTPPFKQYDQVALWESDSLEQYMGISRAFMADSNLYVSSRFYSIKGGIFEEVSAQLFSNLDENTLAEKVQATNIPTAQSKEILDYFKSPASQPKETPFYIRFREKAFSCNLLVDNDLKTGKLIGELIWENGSFKFQ